LQGLVLLAQGVYVDAVRVLGVKHEVPGPGESLLALAASKAHSLSTRRWRLTTCCRGVGDRLLCRRLLTFLLLFAPACESHFAIVFLVLQHVHQVVEQLATVATYQDVGVAVCLEVPQL